MSTKTIAKWALASVIAATVLYTTTPHLLPAADPAPGATGRTPQQILTDLNATQDQLNAVLKPLPAMLDDKTRAEVAPLALPLLKKDLALINELAGSGMANEVLHAKMQFLLIGAFLGDADMEKQLTEYSKSSDAPTAREAQLSLATASWWKNHTDAEAQGKILDQLQVLAKANPNEDSITDTLSTLEHLGAATPALSKRAHSIITTEMKSPLAQKIMTLPNVGEAFAFTGPTVEGKKFDTTDWKGKVIMVDFWATWCGPCIGELPNVKKAYADFHDKGFEIIGVSCDYDGEKLKSFTAKNEMPWPQMWDASKQTSAENQWHELAKKFGVDGIPTMFLIDRNGVLRYTDARENLEEKIKLLTEEKPAAPAVK